MLDMLFNTNYIELARIKNIVWVLLILLMFGCALPTEKDDNKPPKRFPEVFLEAGSDTDTTYISLKTVRLPDQNLKIEATGWGVEEYGLFLDRIVEDKILKLYITGRCGTVFTRTWVKRTFDYTLTPAAEDTLQKIRFANRYHSLYVIKE